MFDTITFFVGRLRQVGLFDTHELADVFNKIGTAFDDQDYRSWLMGEVALAYADTGLFDQAERFASQVETYERAQFFRKLAGIEVHSHAQQRGVASLRAAELACALFPTEWQRAECLCSIAESWFSELNDRGEAIRVWQSAADAALLGESSASRNTTTASDTASVLLQVCRSMSHAGYAEQATRVASLISCIDTRNRALSEIAKTTGPHPAGS